ncbi:MAG: membrane dipeptidase, partial [Myxococcales bacterium]|nr:membrane dipeptidase [Myxococcales bacterium]
KGWLRIVNNPKDARDVINQGKLAVILGIEISNLFDCFLTPPKGFKACTAESVSAKLDDYHKRGVRVIFPVHKFDNGFSAGDGHRGIIELGNFLNSGHYSNFITEGCEGPETSFDHGDVVFGGLNKPRESYDSKAPHDVSGFVDDPLTTLAPYLSEIQGPALKGNYCQKTGLTPLGKTLIEMLMKRGMIIDIAHLPRRALSEAYTILEKNDYPATKTHGSSNDGRVYALGGMVGADLGRCSDENQPGAMGKGLANAVALAKEKGTYPAEGLGFDLNGFAGGPRPRFGPNTKCSGTQKNPITYPFKSFDGKVTFTQPSLGERKVDFNQEGMIHIGLLPELIEDVRHDGVDDKALEPLFRSAEAYLRMWEKAESRAKQLSSQ